MSRNTFPEPQPDRASYHRIGRGSSTIHSVGTPHTPLFKWGRQLLWLGYRRIGRGSSIPQSSLFLVPILIIGGTVINRGLSVLFLPLCRVGVTNKFFSSIHLVRTRLDLYNKKPAYMFKMNKIIFRLHLDMSRGVFWLPGKKKADTKLTVVMCCQIFDKKSLASSSSVFWRRLVTR